MSAIKTYAVYKEGMLVLEDPVNLKEHTRVEVVIRKKFSEFVKKFGEPEAKEDIDHLLLKNSLRNTPLILQINFIGNKNERNFIQAFDAENLVFQLIEIFEGVCVR